MRKQTAREIERQSRWQELVRRQREGGQTVRAFCRQAGIEESAFYWWRRELERRDGHRYALPDDGERRGKPALPNDGGRRGKPARLDDGERQDTHARPERRKPSGAPAKARFLPVQLADRCDAGAGRTIEIVLGDRRVLRVMPGFDCRTLADVLAVLESRPC